MGKEALSSGCVLGSFSEAGDGGCTPERELQQARGKALRAAEEGVSKEQPETGDHSQRQSCAQQSGESKVSEESEKESEKCMLGLASGRTSVLHIPVWEPRSHVCSSCAGGPATEQSRFTRGTWGEGGVAGLCQEGGEHRDTWDSEVVSCRPVWRGLHAVHDVWGGRGGARGGDRV